MTQLNAAPANNTPQAGRLRLIALAAALPCFGIVLALGVVELAFRAFYHHDTIAWRDRPARYFIAENSPTFQDYPHSVSKAEGVFRIAVIGDSFTFAPYMQFDDAFPKRLERWFNLNSVQLRVEVINYGVPAYSTQHELPVVARAIAEQADLVVVQITLNDPELKPYTPQELLLEKNKFGALELPDNWIYRHWHSLVFVLQRLHNNQTRSNYTRKFFDLFERNTTWSNFRDAWTRISKVARKKNTPLVAVVFPLFGVPVDEKYPFWPLHEKISSLLSSLNVPHLDLSERYRGIPVERLQVLPGEDFHPNEIAHRMAAEGIYEWLSAQKIVPEAIVAKRMYDRRIGIKLEDRVEAAP